MALPSWLMQSYTDLQLNRQGSSGKRVKLNFDLQCSVQSSGEPVITWILPDGTKIVAPSDNSDERLSISADGKLQIKMAEHKDAGNYYCVAKVDEDVAISPFYVSIQDSSNPQPGEDQTTTPVELVAGNSLNLDCNGFGSPDPEVNWIIPNGNIVSFKSNTSRVSVYSNGTLHISQSVPPDSGFYKCVVLNQYVFQQMPIENITATENGIVYLDCTANGSPQPTIRWTTPQNIKTIIGT
uniref:Ig-like domain-containing protein n=1 Tax=Periophthalmus magnuspinnatus TaxID=409849 RepID=A0A3B4BH54_9GOBI